MLKIKKKLKHLINGDHLPFFFFFLREYHKLSEFDSILNQVANISCKSIPFLWGGSAAQGHVAGFSASRFPDAFGVQEIMVFAGEQRALSAGAGQGLGSVLLSHD